MNGKAIRVRAKLRGLTLEQLAVALNYSRKGFYNLIVEDSMPISVYLKMCELLQVPFGTFVLDEKTDKKVRSVVRLDVILDKLDELQYMLQHLGSQLCKSSSLRQQSRQTSKNPTEKY